MMNNIIIKCKCGATGYGRGAGNEEIEIQTIDPEEWTGGNPECKHEDTEIESVDWID